MANAARIGRDVLNRTIQSVEGGGARKHPRLKRNIPRPVNDCLIILCQLPHTAQRIALEVVSAGPNDAGLIENPLHSTPQVQDFGRRMTLAVHSTAYCDFGAPV